MFLMTLELEIRVVEKIEGRLQDPPLLCTDRQLLENSRTNVPSLVVYFSIVVTRAHTLNGEGVNTSIFCEDAEEENNIFFLCNRYN